MLLMRLLQARELPDLPRNRLSERVWHYKLAREWGGEWQQRLLEDGRIHLMKTSHLGSKNDWHTFSEIFLARVVVLYDTKTDGLGISIGLVENSLYWMVNYTYTVLAGFWVVNCSFYDSQASYVFSQGRFSPSPGPLSGAVHRQRSKLGVHHKIHWL